MFIPGETIAHEIYLPIDKADITKVIVTYRQKDHIVLIRDVYPRQIEDDEQGSHFVITLSQEESLLFEDDEYFYIQANVVSINTEYETRATSIELRGINKLQHFREVVT